MDAGKIMILFQGDYSNEKAYEILDIVRHKGSLFGAKKSMVAVEPGEYTDENWMLLIDGNKIDRAEKDGLGNVIADTYLKKNEMADSAQKDGLGNIISEHYVAVNNIVNNKSTSVEGYAVDARQLNESIEGTYAYEQKEQISEINANLGGHTIKSDVPENAKFTDTTYNSLPASDVYSWAKQPSKPSYSKSEVGLGNVDNTSDANKPISTAVQNALNSKQGSLGFTPVQQGGGSGQAGNKICIGWSGNRLKAQVDNADLGNFCFDGHTHSKSQITDFPSNIATSVSGKSFSLPSGLWVVFYTITSTSSSFGIIVGFGTTISGRYNSSGTSITASISGSTLTISATYLSYGKIFY